MNAPEDKISRKAYEIWEAEGRPHGRDRDHWHKAEAELAGEPVKPKAKRAAAKTGAAAGPDKPKRAARKPATAGAKAKPKGGKA
ncbi:MAG TPA: DUF2934 domain-containing protein [Devosiaceae bacterium]